MSCTNSEHSVIETRKEVRVPRVGRMIRIVRKCPRGEVLDVEYRRPGRTDKPANGASGLAG